MPQVIVAFDELVNIIGNVIGDYLLELKHCHQIMYSKIFFVVLFTSVDQPNEITNNAYGYLM